MVENINHPIWYNNEYIYIKNPQVKREVKKPEDKEVKPEIKPASEIDNPENFFEFI